MIIGRGAKLSVLARLEGFLSLSVPCEVLGNYVGEV